MTPYPPAVRVGNTVQAMVRRFPLSDVPRCKPLEFCFHRRIPPNNHVVQVRPVFGGIGPALHLTADEVRSRQNTVVAEIVEEDGGLQATDATNWPHVVLPLFPSGSHFSGAVCRDENVTNGLLWSREVAKDQVAFVALARQTPLVRGIDGFQLFLVWVVGRHDPHVEPKSEFPPEFHNLKIGRSIRPVVFPTHDPVALTGIVSVGLEVP